MSIVAVLALAGAFAVGGLLLGRWAARRRAEVFLAGVQAVAAAVRRAAEVERTEILRAAALSGRDEARALTAVTETFCQVREAELAERAGRLADREQALGVLEARLAAALARGASLRGAIAGRERQLAALREEVPKHAAEARRALEGVAGEPAASAREAIRESEIEGARAFATRTARITLEQASEAASKSANRIMSVAVSRFQGHYLTERMLSVIPIGGQSGAAAGALAGPDEANLRAIEAVAGVSLALGERGDSIRLDGLDGVGREIARRTLAELQRQPRRAWQPAEVTETATTIARALDRELFDLGRRAFATLAVPAAHPEIVKLVGRLNYRTSYTQNQWKHAVEAGFLCGMMADELGLDRKLARRAALMHDIGKALTHELDGSHAVIGADYARRLGEPETVANAIGAHHTDEPFGSPYAYLVAAADAMSGARPGARRQTDESYLSRIEDLERITRGFRGVAAAFAVQGGREVRVYVEEDRVDDLGAVTLSGEIAAKISKEMRFPGQIRVTVIRELRAEEVAS